MKKLSDVELVEQLQQGKETAFEELYQRYEKSLYYFAMRLTNNKGDAEDAVQETFLQVNRSIHQLQNPAFLKLWLNRIVSGKCKDIFRRNKSVPVDTSDQKISNHYVEERREYIPEKSMRFSSDREVVLYYVDRLPYVQKEVVLLAYFEHLTMQEIADVLNEPIGTIKSRLFLAKKALRSSLSAYESREHMHIDFRSINFDALLTASLLEGFQKLSQGGVAVSALTFFSKLKSLFVTEAGKITIGVVAMGVVGTSVAAYDHIQSQKVNKEIIETPALPQASLKVADKTINTQQDAYFVLMNWAMNEKQLEMRDQAEFETYRPLYEYLKENKGAYWDTLVTSGYSKVMEEKLK